MTEEEINALQARFSTLDTSAVSDALDSLGLYGTLNGITARVTNQTLSGPAYTVQYRSFARIKNTFHQAGNYIDNVPSRHIVLIDNEGRHDCTSWGSLLTEMAQIKNIAGTVVYGAIRDLSEIRARQYPLFSTAINMVSGKNRVHITALQQPIIIDTVTVHPGDWLIADDNGVIAIAANQLLDILTRAEKISQTEKNIRQAILSGMSLQDARQHFRYDQPWLNEHTLTEKF